MKLFNPKTIARYIYDNAAIPSDHLDTLEKWRELIKSGRIKDYKETAFHGEFKSRIVESVLGYIGPGEAHDHNVSQEQAILKGSVDLALGNFEGTTGQVIAPFELKDANTDPDAIMPGRAKSPVQQAWEYATNAPGVKWVLVSNYLEIRLYGFGEGTQAYEHFDLSQLTEPSEYARFILLLSAENLLSGKTADLLKESRREDKDITNALYADYKELRGTLIFTIQHQLPDLDPVDTIAAAQKVLDRILFTAFAEDTGLLPDSILEFSFEQSNPLNPQPIWDNFKGLFAAINSGNKQLDVPPYNGGLFASDSLLDNLNIPDDVCEKFRDIGSYDFASEISVTVLGHIFEQSIADVERLQAIARGEETEPEKKTGTSGRRKRDGVVYTPDYIARFIVEQTLGTHLREIFAQVVREFAQKGADPNDYETIKWKRKSAEQEAWETYRDRLKTLRIVDPACGSGVFLVMAFDYMKAELTRVNDKIADLQGGALGLFDPDSEILTNNLFGVDVNSESVEIAKLSLWVKTARRGKPLDSLDANLKVGDSLIEDSNYAYLSHGFTWASAFPDVFAEDGFDIVLGNPPYVRMEFIKAMKPYLENRFEVVSDRADLYCYFFERGLKLLKPGGRLGYISSSTFFKTGSGEPLRNFLRSQATLETVVNFGDLQIFEGVTTYPAILTMCRGESEKDHALRFWNIDSLPESNFRASFSEHAEKYPQSALSSNSWELESPALKALRDKIRGGKKTLKEVCGSPLYGIKTGLNEAFVIDAATKERLCAEDPKSSYLLKPFLEGKDLKRWRAESRGLWIIYIPKNRINIEDYPAIQDWLIPFKERLEMRATKQEWFELQQAQEAYVPHFEAAKISYKDIADSAPFHLDRNGRFLANTGYFIPSSDLSLLAFLNSRLCWFIYLNVSAQIRGGFVRFFTQFVEQLPIPSTTEKQRSELATLTEACQTAAENRFKLQRSLTRRIPDLAPTDADVKLSNKLKSWWELPDFAAFQKEVKKSLKADIPLAERNDWEDWIAKDKAEIARLTAEIKLNEDRINAIVFKLFDLTPEEIELLEANI
ncbi:MAG: DNA methyltransferase [Pseudomonadota bacterium]